MAKSTNVFNVIKLSFEKSYMFIFYTIINIIMALQNPAADKSLLWQFVLLQYSLIPQLYK